MRCGGAPCPLAAATSELVGVLPQLSSCGAVMVGSSNTLSDVRWWLVSMGPRAMLSQSFLRLAAKVLARLVVDWRQSSWRLQGVNPRCACRNLDNQSRPDLDISALSGRPFSCEGVHPVF